MKLQESKLEPLLMSRAAAARALSITTRSVDHLIKSERLPSVRIGARTMIPTAGLIEFAAKGTNERIRPAQ